MATIWIQVVELIYYCSLPKWTKMHPIAYWNYNNFQHYKPNSAAKNKTIHSFNRLDTKQRPKALTPPGLPKYRPITVARLALLYRSCTIHTASSYRQEWLYVRGIPGHRHTVRRRRMSRGQTANQDHHWADSRALWLAYSLTGRLRSPSHPLHLPTTTY